jgi:hypothetical protein
MLASIPGELSTSLRHRMAFFTVTAMAEFLLHAYG